MEEKDKNKRLIVLIVILVILVIGLGSYITYDKFLKKDEEVKENNDKKEETPKKDEPTHNENKDNKEEEKSKEEIKLSEEELKEYLSYVPHGSGVDFNVSAYKNTRIAVDTIDKMGLLGMSLGYAYNNDGFFYKKYLDYVWEDIGINFQDTYDKSINYVEGTKIDTLLQKMYNIRINSLNLKKDKENFTTTNNGICYSYIENGFAGESCAGGLFLFNLVEDYKVDDDLLIIEAYNAEVYAGGERLLLTNVYKKQEYYYDPRYELSSNITLEEQCKKYVEEHKEQFTKYKHTFKKNNTGYYWYSTEVIS